MTDELFHDARNRRSRDSTNLRDVAIDLDRDQLKRRVEASYGIRNEFGFAACPWSAKPWREPANFMAGRNDSCCYVLLCC